MKTAVVGLFVLTLLLSIACAANFEIVHSASQVTPPTNPETSPTPSATPQPTAEPGNTLGNWVEVGAAVAIIVLVAGVSVYLWKCQRETNSTEDSANKTM